MSVGQFARKVKGKANEIGLRTYSLVDQTQKYLVDGLDKNSYSADNGGAFDSSALFDPTTDTMIAVGSNGTLYTVKLNTVFDYNQAVIKISPSVVSGKYRVDGEKPKSTAVESSFAMYGPYVYYADVGGYLRCVDTSNMTVKWVVKTGDEVDAAVSLDFDDNGQLWVYTANTLTNRGKGDANIRRYNAETGAEGWSRDINVMKGNKGKKTAGVKASAVIGANSLDDLCYYTVNYLTRAATKELFGEDQKEAAEGALIALRKDTGEIVWAQKLDTYAYASPVAVYNTEGRGWIVQITGSGEMTLFDGLTGQPVSTLKLDGEVEASPAVYRNMLVVATTSGKKKIDTFVYGIALK